LSHIAQQRTHAATRLRALAGVELSTLPEATFVLFPNISATGLACETLAARIEQFARVRVVPGSPRWFGHAASGHIRLSLATTRATLDEALDRITASWSSIIDVTHEHRK
jgi:aspartate/methionine/tyrosine aminotransferase